VGLQLPHGFVDGLEARLQVLDVGHHGSLGQRPGYKVPHSGVRHCEEVDVVAGAGAFAALQIEFWMNGGQQESWISRKAIVAANNNFRMSGGAAGKFECWISRHGVVNASFWMSGAAGKIESWISRHGVVNASLWMMLLMIWMMSGGLNQTDGGGGRGVAVGALHVLHD
jgi:hypothetical protein